MNFKLELSLDTVNACLTALGKLPYEFAAQHINTIQQQAGPQFEAAQAAAQAEAASNDTGLTD